MKRKAAYVIWIMTGIIMIAIMTIGVEIGEESECINGSVPYAYEGNWACAYLDDVITFYNVNVANNITQLNSSMINATGNVSIEGELYVTERIGIGTTSPLARLYVDTPNAAGDMLNLHTSNSNGNFNLSLGFTTHNYWWTYWGEGVGNDNKLELWTEGAAGNDVLVYRIYQNGNTFFNGTVDLANGVLQAEADTKYVGVNTTSPSSALHVEGLVRANDITVDYKGKIDLSTGAGEQIYSGSAGEIWYDARGRMLFRGDVNDNNAADDIILQINTGSTSNKMLMLKNGRTAWNTALTKPELDFQVNGSVLIGGGNKLYVTGGYMVIQDQSYTTSNADPQILLEYKDGQENITFDKFSSGYGDGTTFIFSDDAATDGNHYVTGNLGVGTKSPGHTLQVTGSAYFDGIVNSTGYAVNNKTGVTDSSSYWLCTADDCSATCQIEITSGIITGCT